MKEICQEHDLLCEENGLIRVPFIVKGKMVLPPDISRSQVVDAFAGLEPETGYVRLPQAQLLREPVIHPDTLHHTGEYQYQVMPVVDPHALIEMDFCRLVNGPYALRVDEILDYLRLVTSQLQNNWATVNQVRRLCARTSHHPQPFLDGAFLTLLAGLDPVAGRCMIDQELAAWGLPGSCFLEGWQEVPGQVIPGLAASLAKTLPGYTTAYSQSSTRTMIRAMPTRQLHITAGNAPQVPLISALRLLLTKSAGVIKFPFEATLPGALFALAACTAAPEHPLTKNLSGVYWQGGDETIENILLMPGAFDRIVVWGAPQAVTAVQQRASFTKVISFNPRYGVSLIGHEACKDNLEMIAFLGAQDALIFNQKACNASLVHYIEASPNEAIEYARRLSEVLSGWDTAAPQFVLPAQRGQVKRMRRGIYAREDWMINHREGEYSSGVVVMKEEFDILEHPLSRLVVVRPVTHLEDALQYLHAGVSTVGVYPEKRREDLLDEIAARGVSNIFPLGQCERIYPGIPQDGMLTLSELVDWKNG